MLWDAIWLRNTSRNVRIESPRREASKGQHTVTRPRKFRRSFRGITTPTPPLLVPTSRVTEILHGQRAVTGDTALRLAHFFGTSAEFWLNLQSLYELRLAEAKAGKAIKKLTTLKHLEEAQA